MIKSFKIKKTIFLPVIASLVLISGCGSNSFLSEFITRNFTYKEFDKKNLLDNIGKNVIIPEYNNFAISSANLNTKVNSFITNPDETNLESAQKAWKESISSWQKIETFQFGPVKDLNIASKIYFWPVRPDAIQEVLNKDKTTLSDNYLSTVGVTKKGLPVIEYLLFDPKGNSTIQESFNNGANAETRKRYLQLLAKDLSDNAQAINKLWSVNQGNYLAKLLNESNAFNMLVNNMIATLETIKDKKIGIPLGKKSGGEIRPDEAESLQSSNSKNNIIDNLQSIKYIFNGSKNINAKVVGFDDYLEYVERDDLTTQINSQIDNTIKSLNLMTSPLSVEVNKEPQKIENIYNQVQELLKLIKVDMANAVNETVQFNVNDGD